jgi:hypothetical protein
LPVFEFIDGAVLRQAMRERYDKPPARHAVDQMFTLCRHASARPRFRYIFAAFPRIFASCRFHASATLCLIRHFEFCPALAAVTPSDSGDSQDAVVTIIAAAVDCARILSVARICARGAAARRRCAAEVLSQHDFFSVAHAAAPGDILRRRLFQFTYR